MTAADATENTEGKGRPLIWAFTLFATWMAATWLMEGLPQTLLRPEAVGLRLAYAVGVNIALGIGVGGWVLSRLRSRDAVTADRTGLAGGIRPLLTVPLGLLLGGGLYALQGAPTWHPIVLANAFAQVLVVSTAEVVVCWAVVGNVVRESFRNRSTYLGGVTGTLVASILFGVYHFAHSPPFNTLSMVGLLTVVGLLTSAFYFLSRDVWGTVTFHNCLGVYGVVQALERQEALAGFQAPRPTLFVTATVALCTLAAVQYALRD